MTGKKCYKEAELAIMGSDIKYIIKMLEGEDGLVHEVKQNTAFKNKAIGILAVFGAGAGLLGAVIGKLIERFL